MFEPVKMNDRASSQERTLVLRQSPSAAPSTSPFQNPADARSFQFYVCKTADLISLYSQRHFWSTIIPQATHQHTSVKHSVLALSILHHSLSRTDGLTEDDNRRMFHHYNSAIRVLTQSQPTTDIVLITCILFWTVENFNGAGQPSFDHMAAAQRILREFKTKDDAASSPFYNIINRFIEPVILDGVQHARVRRAEDVTEEVQELEISECANDYALPHHLPTTFTNLSTACDHLKACTRTLLHVLNSNSVGDGDNRLVEQIEIHLRRWMYVFHSLTAVGTAYKRRMLVIHHINVMALLSERKRDLDLGLEDDEDLKNQYKWNVTDMEELLAEVPDLSSAGPLHELGIIPPLFAAAVRCPDPNIRTRALDLLKQMDRVEGCWTDSVASRIAEAIAASQAEGSIGLRLNKISFYRSDWGIGICGDDPAFDRLLPGSEEEANKFDMVSQTFEWSQSTEIR
jgi:hypothetical protein